MILGITGTDGAGKGTVVDYLVQNKGFSHYSVRSLLIEEISKRGLPVDRNHMRLAGNQLRREHGNSYFVDTFLNQAKKKNAEKVVIDSIRSIGEAEALKGSGGILVAVDADQKLRFQRVQARRSESDRVTFEQFVEHETLEMQDPDPYGMQKTKVIEMANHIILNNGSLGELHEQIENVLKKIERAKNA